MSLERNAGHPRRLPYRAQGTRGGPQQPGGHTYPQMRYPPQLNRARAGQVEYFVAHMLLSKVRQEWHELPPAAQQQLTQALYGKLHIITSQPVVESVVVRRLSMVLAAAAAGGGAVAASTRTASYNPVTRWGVGCGDREPLARGTAPKRSRRACVTVRATTVFAGTGRALRELDPQPSQRCTMEV